MTNNLGPLPRETALPQDGSSSTHGGNATLTALPASLHGSVVGLPARLPTRENFTALTPLNPSATETWRKIDLFVVIAFVGVPVVLTLTDHNAAYLGVGMVAGSALTCIVSRILDIRRASTDSRTEIDLSYMRV